MKNLKYLIESGASSDQIFNRLTEQKPHRTNLTETIMDDFEKAVKNNDAEGIRKGKEALKKSFWPADKIEKKEKEIRDSIPQKLKNPKPVWDAKKYEKWIKSSAAHGGSKNAWGMARNARFETGLLDYVEKMIRKDGGDEDALERIQWDIEALDTDDDEYEDA